MKIDAQTVAKDWADTINADWSLKQTSTVKFYHPDYSDAMATLISEQAAEIERLRGALHKIAKPALGGKLQQQIAQQALQPLTVKEV